MPSWIELSRKAFDLFSPTEISIEEREESFSKLLQTMVQPMTEHQIPVAEFQYNMLQRMMKIIKDDELTNEDTSLKSVIYRVCTNSKLYSDVELALKVMLYSVGTVTNEWGIESLISSISRSNSKGRPISLEQVHKELMIKKNGPHPLDRNITKFLHESLFRHFSSIRARLKGMDTEEFEMTGGVPQGSALSGLLFILCL